MDSIETTLFRLAATLSRALDPVMLGLQRLGAAIRGQMDAFGVPYTYQSPILTGAWVLALFLVLRTLGGWLRVIGIVVAAVLLAKAYGYLPGA